MQLELNDNVFFFIWKKKCSSWRKLADLPNSFVFSPFKFLIMFS